MSPDLIARPRVIEFSLRNGLTVLLAPIPESPTASVWVWYRVGSKNERPGITGASHWVEHMLFQGSPNFPKGAIDRAVQEVGGQLNAGTDADFTAYFTTVPRQHLEIPLAIESDRMTRALITDPEVERERTVIYSEREGNENWPEFRVEEEMHHLGFTLHPYRWDALGLKEDIRGLTGDGLRAYYRRFYGTRNAVLVVAGGFVASSVRREIERRFGKLPAGGEDPTVRVNEVLPHAERRATLTGPGTTPFIEIGWRAPALTDPQAAATVLVDVVLGGETGMFTAASRWSRAREHPSARLYRRLVDTGLAVRATSDYRPRVHPSLFTIEAQAVAGTSRDRLEAAIDEEVGRLIREGPSRSEMEEARTKIRRGAQLAYEGSTRAGFRIGYFAAVAPRGFEQKLFRQLLALTPRQVQQRARELFDRETRVVVGYEPTGESVGS